MNRKKKPTNKVILWMKKSCLMLSMVTMASVCTPITMNGMELNEVFATTTESITKTTPVISVKKRTATTAELKIQIISEASSYKVYRSTSKTGSYSYVGTTQDGTYKDTGLKAKQTYYYKVRAVKGQKYSKYSNIVKVDKTLDKVKNVKVAYASKKATVRWNVVNGATKYRVYRSTTKNGTYERVATTDALKYIDNSVVEGKVYYYKVRAMKVINKVEYFGAFSTAVKVQCKATTSDAQSSYIDEVLRLVNVERKKEGLPALSTTNELKQAANQRAMEIKSEFSHNRPDGRSCFTVLPEYNVTYRAAGENIAWGQRTPEEVVAAWMNSEGHRKNIMNSGFDKLGVGCYLSNGTYYWTQLFIS